MIIKGRIGYLKINGNNNIIMIIRDIKYLNLTGSSNKIYMEKNLSNIIFNGSNNVIKMKYSQPNLSKVDYGQNNKISFYRLSLQNNLNNHFNEEEPEKIEDEKNISNNGFETPVNKTPIRRMDAINNTHFIDDLYSFKNRNESEKSESIITPNFFEIQNNNTNNRNNSNNSNIINTNIINTNIINNNHNFNINYFDNNSINNNNNNINTINTINDDNEVNIDDYIDRDINTILFRSYHRPTSHGRPHRRNVISRTVNQRVREDNTENEESKLINL